MFFDTPQLAAG